MSKAASLIESFGLWFCVVVLGTLTIGSALVTYASPILESEGDLSEIGVVHTAATDPLMVFGTVVICLVLMIVLGAFANWGKCPDWHVVLIVVCIVISVAQVAWIFAQGINSSWYSDARQLLNYAQDLALNSGDKYFDKSELSDTFGDYKTGTLYLSFYPYQSGCLLYFCVMFRLFGNCAPFAIQVVNAISNVVAVASLASVASLFLKSNGAKSAASAALGLCIPNLLYASFLYGNQLGFGFACIFLVLQARCLAIYSAEWKKALITSVVSFIPFAAMCCVKSTFLVVGIAVLVIWVIEVFRSFGTHRSLLPSIIQFSLCIAVVFGGSSTAKIPQMYLESKLGYSLGQGMPKTAWIALGLRDQQEDGSAYYPGWWTRYCLKVQEDTANNYSEMESQFSNQIQSRIEAFAGNPTYLCSFFARKLGSIWGNPMFQADYFGRISYVAASDGSNFIDYANNTPGEESSATCDESWAAVSSLRPFVDGYQTFVYLTACLGCIKLRSQKKRLRAARLRTGEDSPTIPVVSLVLPCVFAVGFFVYLFWEAKSQYTLPFFMCAIPVGSIWFSADCPSVNTKVPCRLGPNSTSSRLDA